jgi:hypothetical protein
MSEKFFRHVDGGLYRFVAYARSADDTSELVVYEHLWPFDQGMWVRKRAEFEARFAPTDELTVKRAMKQDRAEAQERVNAAKTLRRATRAS